VIKISALFLLLSGIASLTYQIVWVRLLGLSMGSTSASISTVLAAFFLGLALGSYLAERITRNRIDNLRVYIVLETVIGLSSLALLPILLNLDAFVAAIPALGGTITMKFVITMVLLITPTMCMGATFPVMAAILIRGNNEVGLRVSQLYSLNTAGAVLGAALAGFVFVPNWGLDGAIYIAFAINVLIVIVALYINRKLQLPDVEASGVLNEPNDHDKISFPDYAPFRRQALIVLFATGLVAIATEVGWTKYLSIFTGATIYGFAAILTIFLLGIASGSWAVKSFLNRIQQPVLWMSMGLILLGGTLLLTRAGLVLIPDFYGSINHLEVSSWVMQLIKYLIVFVLIFPATFLFGALFPLSLKLYCGNLQGVRARIGKAYAINTMASIIGSLIAGFWIIPQYGTDFLLTTMALLLIVVPFVFFLSIRNRTQRTALIAAILVVVTGNWFLPHIEYEKLITSVQFDSSTYDGQTPNYLYLNEGKAGVISMVTFDGRFARLQNNGLNESYLDMEDESNILLVESLLGLVPYFIHKDPKTAFVVGFGGGATTKALTLTPLESIRVVELEPSVVDAVRTIYGGEISTLRDPRVRLDINDARNTLLTEDIKYDIIASQPSHPWLARASNIFSQEFFILAKSRLNENGIYAQWVSLFQMDTLTLKSLLRSFYEVFPYGMTFADLSTGDFIMFGSSEPMLFDFKQINQRLADAKINSSLKHRNINNANDLMLYFALSREQSLMVSKDVPVSTDLNILPEVRLSKNTYILPEKDNPYNFIRKVYRFDAGSYFSHDYAQRLYEVGSYYVDNKNAILISRHAEKQLARLDSVLMRGIEYEKLWRRSKYKEATSFYKQYNDWPDRTHVQQGLSLNEQGLKSSSMDIIKRIKDDDVRRTIRKKLMSDDAEVSKFLALKTKGDIETMWKWVGMSTAP